MTTPPESTNRRLSPLILSGVIGVAIAGYLVGIDAGIPGPDVRRPVAQSLSATIDKRDSGNEAFVAANGELLADSPDAIPAASYAEMRQSERKTTISPQPSLARIHPDLEFQRCISCHNPHTAQVRPNQQDKLASLATRASRRAFNGAPPVIPHSVERTNDAACYACHGEGVLLGQRVANRMSHGHLSHCVQCHAPPPQPFMETDKRLPNSFVGLSAPTAGPRAFDGAPPVIPHSTWMREQCLSCHGGLVGWPGLEVTHRWRTNCTQCHATQADLEQGLVASPPVTSQH